MASDEEPVFFCSDDELAVESDSDQPLAASDSEVFFSSEPEDARSTAPCRPRKRARYNARSSERLKFLGRPVCRFALSRLLQVGDSSLQKLRTGQPLFTNKDRLPLPKHPTFGFTLRGEVAALWEDIVMFLWHIYQTAAEVLPTNWKNIKRETPFFEDDLDPKDERDRLVNSIAQTLHASATDMEVSVIGPGTFVGPRRCVMHGNRTDLYWEYRAYAETRNLRVASQSTFLRVANCCIKPGLRNGHLKFRKPSEHAVCDECYNLREQVRQTKDAAGKLEAQKAFHRHQLSQWLDRQIYWSLRSMSQTWFSRMLDENTRQELTP